MGCTATHRTPYGTKKQQPNKPKIHSRKKKNYPYMHIRNSPCSSVRKQPTSRSLNLFHCGSPPRSSASLYLKPPPFPSPLVQGRGQGPDLPRAPPTPNRKGTDAVSRSSSKNRRHRASTCRVVGTTPQNLGRALPPVASPILFLICSLGGRPESVLVPSRRPCSSCSSSSSSRQAGQHLLLTNAGPVDDPHSLYHPLEPF